MAITLFYISLFFLGVMILMKYFNISFKHHEVISNLVCENDKHCHNLVHHSKKIVSKLKFKNFHKLSVLIAEFIKRESIYLKRRFDSKQPAFFLAPQKPSYITKNSVSFFLKKVSEYKESLNTKNPIR